MSQSQNAMTEPASSQGAFDFKHLDGELFLMRRLKDHGKAVFTGETTREERRERFRQAILEHRCDLSIIGRGPSGKTETYAAFFERLYSQPLEPKKGKSR